MNRHPFFRDRARFGSSKVRRPLLGLSTGLALWLQPHPALADVLTGGLLGSVLRGDPFTGPRVIDLAVLGLIIFALLRLLLGRSKPKSQDRIAHEDDRSLPPEEAAPPRLPRQKPDMYTNAQATWDFLKTRSSSGAPAPAHSPGASPVPADATPDEEFLAGAKMAYPRILGAMAQRDFEDLASFTTPDFLAQLKNSLPLNPPSPPDILLVEAVVADKREEPGRTVREVDYKVLIHEKDAPYNTDRLERWRFVRDNTTPGANWLLEAMQRR